MFIGIQNNIPCFISDSKEELENLSCVCLDEIQEVEFAQMYNGTIYLDLSELISAKEEFVRSIRNNYLEKFIDAIVSNPLRWEAMPEDERQIYINYRQYLLDYTKQENWFESLPKTLAEWQS